jgi:hypothetical protein
MEITGSRVNRKGRGKWEDKTKKEKGTRKKWGRKGS